MLMHIRHPWVGLRQQSPHSAQQDKLSCSVACCPLLFRLSLKWQDRYHRGQLLPLGSICMSASLSASFSVSICHPFIVFFPRLLVPSFIPTNTVFLSVLSLYAGWKAARNRKRPLCGKGKVSDGQNVFTIDRNLISAVSVYVGVGWQSSTLAM